MKVLCIVIMTFTLVHSSTAFAQKKGTASKNKKSKTLPFKLSETKDFFYEFPSNAKPEPRGEFETAAEYKARLPKPWDTTKQFSFWVQENPTYSYDIDHELLQVCAGEELKEYAMPDYLKSHPGLQVVSLVEHETEDKNESIYSDGRSRRMYFEEVKLHYYVFNIQNAYQFPSGVFNDSAHNLCTTLSLPPKEAQRLSEDVAILITARPISYDRSFRDITSFLNPRYGDSDPKRYITWVSIIDVIVDKVFVYDRSKNKVIYEIAASRTVVENKNAKQ